jgi:hypothetical protein
MSSQEKPSPPPADTVPQVGFGANDASVKATIKDPVTGEERVLYDYPPPDQEKQKHARPEGQRRAP